MHCGECKYMGWRGLKSWCRHPDHPLPIRKWPGRCPEFVDQERKVMPHESAPWPDPVDLRDVKEELHNG